ncbi:MAG TPA: hypothetical protein VFN48_01285 [Solirubrobacteraceae bacterium]|nr:hypothetical protein [Solirubrobacteraceae bacterium]
MEEGPVLSAAPEVVMAPPQRSQSSPSPLTAGPNGSAARRAPSGVALDAKVRRLLRARSPTTGLSSTPRGRLLGRITLLHRDRDPEG